MSMDKDGKLIFEAYNYKKAMQSDKARVKKKGIGGAMDAAVQRLKQSIKDEPLNWIEKNRFKAAQDMTENEEGIGEQTKQVMKQIKMLTNNALKNVFAAIETLEGLDSIPYSGEIDALTVNLDEEVGRLMDVLEAKMPKNTNTEN